MQVECVHLLGTSGGICMYGTGNSGESGLFILEALGALVVCVLYKRLQKVYIYLGHFRHPSLIFPFLYF